MKNSLFLIAWLGCLSSVCIAQDSGYSRSIIQTLCSSSFHGRGYVQQGDQLAAQFIKKEFVTLGLKPISAAGYFQEFRFPVNTFPSKMMVKINNHELKAGEDYLVQPESPSCKGTFEVIYIHKKRSLYSVDELKGKWILLDTTDSPTPLSKLDYTEWLQEVQFIKGIIEIVPKKLTWSVSRKQEKIPGISLLKKSVKDSIHHIKINIRAKFIPAHPTANVIGYIEGKTKKDSFLVVTAHYDHLGRMGSSTIFPGANDNASGVSMLLQLGKHYSKKENQLDYSMLFIAFAGEEAGLIGSKYYVEHPLQDLTRIKFLMNMDLLGTGEDGMMVVNATEFPDAFKKLDSLNLAYGYLPKIGQRGKAANSDHYWFTEKGVPSFFCYTLGGISAYHDIYDIEKTLPLTKFQSLQQLFIAFLNSF